MDEVNGCLNVRGLTIQEAKECVFTFPLKAGLAGGPASVTGFKI